MDDAESLRALHAAADAGVTLIDTADVYGDGHSEQVIGRFLRRRGELFFVATKMGRRVPEMANYTPRPSATGRIAAARTWASIGWTGPAPLPHRDIYYSPELSPP